MKAQHYILSVCIDLQRDCFNVSFRWPAASAQQCDMWLRELTVNNGMDAPNS